MSAVAIDLEQLRAWIGRTETRTDLATAVPYAALSATLDREDAEPANGTVVPPLWHWLYFLPLAPMSDVGPDGHPKRGGFLPPVPLPRRMFAGGTIKREPARQNPQIKKVLHPTVRYPQHHHRLVFLGHNGLSWIGV